MIFQVKKSQLMLDITYYISVKESDTENTKKAK